MFISSFDFIVCDLDGTLCDIKHREHLAQQKAWDEFHEGIPNDTPRVSVLGFLGLLRSIYLDRSMDACPVILLTGRPETYRSVSESWLKEHGLFEGEDYLELLMRPKDDFRPDVEVKSEILEERLSSFYRSALPPEQYRKRILILEDRDRVVARFRDLGYECWQVNEGSY